MALATAIPNFANTDEHGFLMALSAARRDGTVALVYADSLEAAGDQPLAEAVRNRYTETAGHVESWGGFSIIRRACGSPEHVAAGQCSAAVHRGDAWKPVWNYRFRDAAERESTIAAWKLKELEIKQRRDAKTAAKKEARAAFVNPTKVGDIFYTSWGYDQTNINFFQCVKITAKSVTLREIAAQSESTGWATGRATPIKGKFIGAPRTVTYQIHATGEGYLPAEHGSYYPHDGQPKSWSSYA